MQAILPTFLALLLAHLVGDFLLQSDRMVADKADHRAGAYVRHGVVHYLLMVGSVVLFTAQPIAAGTLATLLAIAVAHLLVDGAKVVALRRGWTDARRGFLVDQTLHAATLLGAAAMLRRAVGGPGPLLPTDPTLPVLVVYVGVIFAGAELVRIYLSPFSPAGQEVEGTSGLEDAGRHIGRLERFLVLTALVTGSPAAAGLIIAAKSVYRFPELKDRPFAEYFLIGTLLSVSLAVAGALILDAST